MARERPVRKVPVPVLLLLCCGLTLQILWQTGQPALQAPPARCRRLHGSTS